MTDISKKGSWLLGSLKSLKDGMEKAKKEIRQTESGQHRRGLTSKGRMVLVPIICCEEKKTVLLEVELTQGGGIIHGALKAQESRDNATGSAGAVHRFTGNLEDGPDYQGCPYCKRPNIFYCDCEARSCCKGARVRHRCPSCGVRSWTKVCTDDHSYDGVGSAGGSMGVGAMPDTAKLGSGSAKPQALGQGTSALRLPGKK